MKTLRLFVMAAILFVSLSAFGAAVKIDIDCNKPAAPLSQHLYGLFFEDINFAADGGLYAELVQNRSFEYYPVRGNDPMGKRYHALYAWTKVERGGAECELAVEHTSPLNGNNTNYLKIQITQPGAAAGVFNAGFDGIRLDAGHSYDMSVYARISEWSGSQSIQVALELADGTICAQSEFHDIGAGWQKFEAKLTSSRTADNARLLVTTAGKGNLYLDMVSLFPQDTFNGRKNGMRKDLGQALEELNPKFLRFPGGCIAHGDGLANIYRWKDTVGDVAERKPNWNRWGYHQTYGLGYFEYFLLSEDIGATPLPVIPVGVSCGFTPPQECVPMDQLGPWIQDALDLIEFANGPVTTKWGGLRAKMGHPEPFNLEFVALGNEPHDNALFRDRFPLFAKAIREAHPEIKIIGTSGLGPEIPIYDLMTKEKVYSSDEHYYMSPQWFIANQNRFDKFDRSKPKIFVGEYASQGNTLFNALAEAVYLTGIERNGDIVDMACYAPLFANVNHTQWKTDLIYFDNRNLVKTPNYYVQQLFAQNKGDVYLANTVKRIGSEKPATVSGGVGVGTWKTAIEVEDVRVNGRKLDPSKWKVSTGDFRMKDGRYVQSNTTSEPAISFSTEKFNDDAVTYTLRARKTGGDEGFLVVFGASDSRHSYWWNIGGWGNTRHAIQLDEEGERTILVEKRGRIESKEWYDIKVALTAGRIKCYLNGQLIHDYSISQPFISISPTLDKVSGEVIVKLVNPTAKSVDATINLNGVEKVQPEAKLIVLSGQKTDENSLSNPDHVKPATKSIKVGKSFNYTLPPMSVQAIRGKVQ